MSVARLCESSDDARTLRLTLLAELRRLVPFDAHAWLLTDPETEVGTSPIAEVPCLPQLPTLIRLKYSTTVNRWTHQRRPVSRLAATTGGELDRSLVWRELLAHHDVTDVASIVFRDRWGCWAFLDLWRTGGRFTDDEADRLAGTVDVVTGALRRAAAATFATPAGGPDVAAWTGPVVLVLSDELDIQAQTPRTDGLVRTLVPPDGDRPPIPSAAYNVAAQLLANERGVDAHPPMARVQLSGSTWVTLRAARLADAIAVSIEATTPDERLDLYRRSLALTPREAEVLGLVVTGADTRGIAAQLFLSPHTVQDHLKSIFAKTGTRTRRELVARAVGR